MKDTIHKQAEEDEQFKNLELLSNTAMQFVEFSSDKNIYDFIGNLLREFTGKDSYVIVNSTDTESKNLTTRAIIGMGKLSKKVINLIGKNPVGMTYNAKHENLDYLFDGKLHLYKEGLYGISLKTIPKTVSSTIEKLLNIKSIFTIGLIKNNDLFGTIAILLKENASELKNNQLIETFVKQASIAVQKRQAEESLKESNENFQQVVSNITTVIWKATIGKNGTFENTYISPVIDELLELPAGTIKNDWDKYFKYIKPEYLERVNNAFREAIISQYKVIDCEYELLKDNGQTAYFHSNGRCFEKSENLYVFGTTIDITERKQDQKILKDSKTKLQLLYDSSSDAIMLLDENGFYDCNEATLQLFGCTSRDEFCSKHPSDFSPPTQPDGTDSMSYARNNIQVALKEGSKRFEHLHRRSDGTDFLADVLLNALILEGRKVIQARVYDITERKQAEKLLQKSEAQLRQIIDIVPHFIFAKDRDGRFIIANKAVADGGATTPENIVGKTHPELLGATPEQYEAYLNDDREVIDSGKLKFIPEEDYTHPDGHTVIMETTKIPFTSAGIPAILGVSVDITERKRAEEALQERESQLRAVLDNATIHIWAFDGELYPYLSKEWYRYTGQDPTLPRTIERWTEVVHPDDLDETEKTWFKAWDSKSIYDGYFRLRNSKGKYRLFHSHAVPVNDEKDKLLHYQGYNIDITEQKQTREALRKSEEKYRLLADNSIDVIWKMDLKLVFTYASSSVKNIFGYTVEEFIGTRLSQHANTKDFFYMARKALYGIKHYKEFKYLNFDTVMLHKDGTGIPVEITGKLLINKEGLPIGLQGTTREITERKRAEEELRKYHEHLEDLVIARTADLETKNISLERFNKLFVGREFRIKELRNQVKELVEQIDKMQNQ